MVDEITEGLEKGGIFHRVKGGAQALKDQFNGKKITIATMPHDILDEDKKEGGKPALFQKNLVYNIRLRSTDESLTTFEKGGQKDQAYENAAEEEKLKREYQRDKKELGLFSIKSKRKLKKEMKKDLAQLEVDEIEFATDLAPVHIDAFIVRENERAMFLQGGSSMGIVEPGMWTIEEDYAQTGTEIIYVDISQFQFDWGYSNIITQEHAKVGVHGNITLKIRDPRNFIVNMISSKKEVSQKNVEEFLETKLKSIIKETIGNYKIADMVHEKDKVFSARIRSSMHDILESWGLDIVDVAVLGFKLPEKFEKLFDEQSDAAVDEVRLDLDKGAAERKVERIGTQEKVNVAKVQSEASVDITKTKLEAEKEKARLELEAMKQKLAREKQQHEAELAKIKRKMNAEDELAKVDVNEIRGKSQARVKKADIDAESTLRDHELKKSQIENRRQTDLERIKAGGEQRKLDHEERLNKMKYDRDVNVAEKTGQGGTYVRDTPIGSGLGSGSGGNDISIKIQELEDRKKKLERKLDNLDGMLTEGKMSDSTYERRSNIIMNEIEDIRREILSIKRIP